MRHQSIVVKILAKLLRLLPFIIVVGLAVPIFGVAGAEAAKLLGYKTVTVEVMGTGSMYPSLYWDKSEGGPEDSSIDGVAEYRSSPLMYRRFNGVTILGTTYARREVSYGDMVAFQNTATTAILEKEGKANPQVGFIKRVIAVGGDTIELRDGYVYKNGQLLDEPYLYLPRSTYGGSLLTDCQPLTVPTGQYFVLGDNRKVSADSRYELGLIQDADISYVLPYPDQSLYQPLWRDTSKDSALSGTPTLDRAEFYQLLNKTRVAANRRSLSPSSALAKSAALRGNALLQNKNTSYNLESAVQDSGYPSDHHILGEFVSYGHFTAPELVQNLLGFSQTATQVMSLDYQDMGITATTRNVNGCPTQVIVGHFGAYVPPEYSRETIESWQSLRDNLKTVIPSWEGAVGYNSLDQTKLAQLLTILRKRLGLAEEIIQAMDKSLWFSDDQNIRIKQDEADADLAESLAQDLNNQ